MTIIIICTGTGIIIVNYRVYSNKRAQSDNDTKLRVNAKFVTEMIRTVKSDILKLNLYENVFAYIFKGYYI